MTATGQNVMFKKTGRLSKKEYSIYQPREYLAWRYIFNTSMHEVKR